MQTSVHFRCASCGVKIKAPAQLIGHTRPCPACGDLFVVPELNGQDHAGRIAAGLACSCSLHPAFVCANSSWACQDRDILAARARAVVRPGQISYGFAS